MLELRDLTFRYSSTGDPPRPPRCAAGTSTLHALDEGELVLVARAHRHRQVHLLGVFNGLVPVFTGGRLEGDVLLDGASILDLPPRDRAHAFVGYVGPDNGGFVTDTRRGGAGLRDGSTARLDGTTVLRRVEGRPLPTCSASGAAQPATCALSRVGRQQSVLPIGLVG